ncbi:MAG TPA: YkgJ family cysteine cluster protein [Oligoflexia bacterium]|nr:YkgJ family cysteine cluster protein [Oligoflexia bacterium]
MFIETDLKRIKDISKKQEKQNFRFRTFLKWEEEPSARELDDLVHRLHVEISEQIDCTACGNCCREMLPLLAPSDITRLTAGLKMTPDTFQQKYLKPAEEPGLMIFNTAPCPFLADNKCSVYKLRPKDCRSYPHLHKKHFASRLLNVIENCEVCPIVFNVYEQLKEELMPQTDEQRQYDDLLNELDEEE